MSRGVRRLPILCLRALVPLAERDELAADLEAEFQRRRVTNGGVRAHRWLWGQLIVSLPPLLRRSWLRGTTGFDARANAMNPGGPIMERWMLETRYAVRRLRRRPGYAILAVLTLALGIGGMAAISGIARALLIDPLPYPRSAELARFWRPGDWRAKEVTALRGQWSDFSAVAAYRPKDVTLERERAAARVIPGIASSAELLRVLQVAPLLGRGFLPNEDRPGAAPVAILSHALWRELGSDPRLAGTRLTLDGIAHTVIGVMPRGFWFPDPSIGVWTNDTINATGGVGFYTLVGRVVPGKRVNNMQPALDRVTRLLGEQFTYEPQWDMTKNATLTPFRDWMVGGLRPALYATLAGMAAILLIACANVAALILGQIESRSGELALRAALGADRGRLTTQLIIEVMVLGLVAGVVGSAFAAVSFNMLRGALSLGAWGERASLDWTLLAAAMGVAVLSIVMIAVPPVLALWRADLRVTLAGARGGGFLQRRGGLQGLMIVGEVALAVLLACAAGLLGRSVAKLYAIPPGFATRGLAVIDIATPSGSSSRDRHTMIRGVLQALGTLPGVRGVAITQRIPLRGRGWTMGLRLVGAPRDAPSPYFRIVSPGYFATIGIPLRRGRVFDGSDRATDSVASIVVNEALVKVYFPTIDPIGQVMLGGFGRPERIIGIVADVAEGNLTDSPTPARYYFNEQVDFVPSGQTIVVRVSGAGDAERLLGDAQRIIARTVPSMAVQEATTMTRVLARAVGSAREVMTLLGLLTALALALGGVGIYGVISQFVARRRRDWSIRVALGLAPLRVVSQIVRHGTALVLTGVVIGLAATLALARLLSTLLFGVTASDPVALLGAAAVLLAVGVVAALVPALRASRSDPALVLREQ